jgi:hypothetical protein
MDYSKICFVIMPFGKKQVGDQTVDFDRLYDDIFVPAISAVSLPEGAKSSHAAPIKTFIQATSSLNCFRILKIRALRSPI